MSAMSLGELYVKLSLKSADFKKSAAAATKSIEVLGRKVAEAGSKLGALGTIGAAALTGFAVKAAEVNGAIAADVKRVEGAFRALAVQVGQATQPALRSLAETVGTLAALIQQMDPETRALVGNVLAYGSAALIAVGATAKLVGVVAALAPALPVLALVGATVAAIAAATYGLYRAFESNFLGIRDLVVGVAREIYIIMTKMVADTLHNAADLMDFLEKAGIGKGGFQVRGFAMVAQSMANPAGFRAMTRLGEALGQAALKELKDIFRMPDALSVAAPTKDEPAKTFLLGDANGPYTTYMKHLEAEAKKAGTALSKSATKATQTVSQSLQAMALNFATGMGSAGQVLQSALYGFQAGGPLGAAIGALMELVSESTAFGRVIEALNGIVAKVAEILGQLLEPLIPIINIAGRIITVLAESLKPLLDTFAAVIEPLLPVLMVLAKFIEGMAPVIAMVSKALAIIEAPLRLLTNVALKGLFKVLSFVALIIMRVIKGIGDAWNGIIGILANIRIFGKRPFAFLDSLKANTRGLGRAIDDLKGMTWDSAMATAKEKQAKEANAKVTTQVTRAMAGLANLPSWYKLGRTRWESAGDGANTYEMWLELIARESEEIASNVKTLTQIMAERRRMDAQAGQADVIDRLNKAAGGAVVIAKTDEQQAAQQETRRRKIAQWEEFADRFGLPKLAEGGVVKKATVALIGEKGPEAVVPLKGGNGVGGGNVYITVNSHDAEDTFRRLKRLMERDNFRLRGTPIPA